MRFKLGLLVGATIGAAAGYYRGALSGREGLDHATKVLAGAKGRAAAVVARARPGSSEPGPETVDLDRLADPDPIPGDEADSTDERSSPH